MKERGYPIIIGPGLRKGLLASAGRGRDYEVRICWLKHRHDAGEHFTSNEVEKIQTTLRFEDQESLRIMIRSMEWLLQKMEEDGHGKAT